MVCKGGGLATITSLKLLKMRKVYIDGRKNHVRWVYGMSKNCGKLEDTFWRTSCLSWKRKWKPRLLSRILNTLHSSTF